MPSTQALPTIDDFVRAGRGALRGERYLFSDARAGSIYDHAGGPMAVLLAREVERDKDLFADTYFDDASGDALTELVALRYGVDRVLDTRGQGVCRFERTSIAAGAGPLLEGTRVQVPGTPPRIYRVARDTIASASQAVLEQVPIEAEDYGSGVAIVADAGLTLLDPVYDPLWKPRWLSCADGTDYEPANAYRARAAAATLAARNGYLQALVDACAAQGASYVVCFQSQYGLAIDDFDNDFGLNAIYVGDNNFQSTPALIRACKIALESVRVLGADLWVGGIAESPMVVQATVNLVDDPGRLELVPIRRACTQALLAYFAPTSAGYTYNRSALTSALVHAHPSVQQVSAWISPSSDATLAPTNFPATLTRWTLPARNIQLAFVGPS